ncbi:MAG: RnfABCDGE type electron transport complex subunit G [Nitrospirota bacterium]
MREMLKIVISLFAIFVGAGLILSYVYAKTSTVIYNAQVREKEAALKKMSPEAEKINVAGKWLLYEKPNEYYEAKKGNKVISYIASTTGKGYSSYIKILVSTDPDLKIKAIDILSHSETPGLGDEIEKKDFKKQFEGKVLENIELLKVETKDKIQAISGATISSRAVTKGVKEAVKLLNEKYGKGLSKE